MAGRATLAQALATASIFLDERLMPSEADQLQSIALKRILRFTSRDPLSLRSTIRNRHLLEIPRKAHKRPTQNLKKAC